MSIAVRRLKLSILLLTFAGTVFAVPPERQDQLRYLLRQDCGSCHGMTLKGGLGPALLPDNLIVMRVSIGIMVQEFSLILDLNQ